MAKQTLKDPETTQSKVEEIVATPKNDLVKEPIFDPTIINDLVKQINDLKSQNETLMAVADKKALSNYFNKTKKEVPSIIKLRTFEGLVVLSWKTVKDEVFQDPVTRAWRENQIVELIFEDDTTKEVPLVEFVRKYKYLDTTKVGQTYNEDGSTFVKLVRGDNGKELLVNIAFVN